MSRTDSRQYHCPECGDDFHGPQDIQLVDVASETEAFGASKRFLRDGV